MGVFKALSASIDSVARDQYKEYFYCEYIPGDVLVTRAYARQGRYSRNRGDANIITKGSVMSVNDGQAMAVVAQGKITDLVTRPGEYIYEDSPQSGVFSEGIIQGMKENLREVKKRFEFGGITPMTQRLYYFNMREIPGQMYDTSYLPIRLTDRNVGYDSDVKVRYSGTYSFRLIDPLKFYENVSGNVETSYYTYELCNQMTVELLTALTPAVSRLSGKGIRFFEILEEQDEMIRVINEELSDKWRELRGVELVSLGISDFDVSQKDLNQLTRIQALGTLRNMEMAKARLVDATARAMENAAGNLYGISPELWAKSKLPESPKPNVRSNTAGTREGYRCNVCGWSPNEGEEVPKFCPQCGDPFNFKDLILKK